MDRLGLLERDHEDVLGDVLRGVGVEAEARGEPVDGGDMTVVQRAERAGVARGDGREQRAVVGDIGLRRAQLSRHTW
ncbi:hypothetical protein ASG00_07805 [Microbacterium sp. Leaf351]|nr:hypothetical protein ASG00_07805 [Microbacterium sp. Leaf351]